MNPDFVREASAAAAAPDEVERKLLLEGIFLRYGYDFRGYAEPALARRIQAAAAKLGESGPLRLLERALRDSAEFDRLLAELLIGTTELFREPAAFRAIREHAVPILRTYPRLSFWVAGCSTGEEAYSLAILLKEEGLYNRSTIYATDLNRRALDAAKTGIYPLESFKGFAKAYAESGGLGSPSSYYVADYGFARLDPSLRENVLFVEHNLVADGPFVEAHLTMCRNVLIYFDRALQDRALALFAQSLAPRGFLAIGAKETIRYSSVANDFDALDGEARLFRKIPPSASKRAKTHERPGAERT